MAELLTPLLKWAGGKRWLIPTLALLWQPHRHRRLVEPFCGGLSVSLGLQPDRALLNDVNPDLMGFYLQVKWGLTPDPTLVNTPECYTETRDWFNAHRGTLGLEKRLAQTFYYLNRHGFNGLCRYNKSGGFNVPYGRYKNPRYLVDLNPYQEALAGWKLTSRNFQGLWVATDDFIYADPPYDGTFTDYSQGGFDWADQERLALWLSKHPGPVVASNAATDRIINLYQSHGFTVTTLEAPRRISCNGDRTPALEVLATRNI